MFSVFVAFWPEDIAFEMLLMGRSPQKSLGQDELLWHTDETFTVSGRDGELAQSVSLWHNSHKSLRNFPSAKTRPRSFAYPFMAVLKGVSGIFASTDVKKHLSRSGMASFVQISQFSSKGGIYVSRAFMLSISWILVGEDGSLHRARQSSSEPYQNRRILVMNACQPAAEDECFTEGFHPPLRENIRIRVLRGGKPRFVINPATLAFQKHFFPGVSKTEWNDWQWQIKNRIKTSEGLAAILDLSPDEIAAMSSERGHLPFSVTPYYVSLLSQTDAAQALRRTVIPAMAEFRKSQGEATDPLGEDSDSPVTGLVHRYPDRVLFLVTDFCSTYCRYCTRSRMLGESSIVHAEQSRWEEALAYIRENSQIRDVLLSGGDPLTLSDDRLEWLLSRLRRIPHVEIIRIGTKVPAVLPQRITPQLCRMLKRYHPLWMSLHFTHPDELTPETAQACGRLADAGIPLGSQTVLLVGVNDSVNTMTHLMQGLLKIRVRPYYLYQCDPIEGTSHFRTPVRKGLEIIHGLRGYTSGYAVPQYVIDAPGGGGKIPLLPKYVLGREDDAVILENYEGRRYCYPDHGGQAL